MSHRDLEAGPELDRLVAEKVMGWTFIDRKIPSWQDEHGDYRFIGQVFQPSIQIAHAWEVVEHMQSKGFVPNVRGPGVYTVGDGYYKHDEWFVGLQSGAMEAAAVYEQEGEAHAPTAPLAICRAALAALGEKS